jgi:hypothetical protein
MSTQPTSPEGRILPGTRIAVRELTDEEFERESERIATVNTGFDHSDDITPKRWVVVWADHPEKGLYDWFSLVGGQTREEAVEQAERYVLARHAELVELTT